MLSRPWLVLFWSSLAAIGSMVPSLLLQELMPVWPDAIEEFVREAEVQTIQMMGSYGGYVVVCLLAPVVEELVFRGAILRALLQGMSRHWVAIVMSALLFALIHMNPAQMPHAFCLGLLLGWMYYRTRSIIPGIMVHWVNNTVAYALYNIVPNAADMRIVDLYNGDYFRVALSVGFSLLILVPAIFQLHQRMKKEV